MKKPKLMTVEVKGGDARFKKALAVASRRADKRPVDLLRILLAQSVEWIAAGGNMMVYLYEPGKRPRSYGWLLPQTVADMERLQAKQKPSLETANQLLGMSMAKAEIASRTQAESYSDLAAAVTILGSKPEWARLSAPAIAKMLEFFQAQV